MSKKYVRFGAAVILFVMLTALVFVGVERTYASESEYLTVEEMFDINKLYRNNSGWKFQHASSYDMNEGNLDGQFFYKQDNIKYTTVLLDAKGPGVVTRFWTAGYADDEVRKVIHIYVDGKLLLEGYALDFFSGKIKPFVKPYVGRGAESGGGVYSYVPIVFAESILITAEYANYWNIDYTIFPSDVKVRSTVLTEEPVLPSWYKGLSHNIADMTKGQISDGEASFAADDSAVLYQDDGRGVVEGINLVFDGLLDGYATMDAFAADGRWLQNGGSVQFDARLNETNNGAILKWRVDAIWANQIIDVYVDNRYVGRCDSGEASSLFRYKDLYMEIPSELVKGKTTCSVKMVAVSSGGIDVPLLDIWVYSKFADGSTILSTYLDVFNGESESQSNFVIDKPNGSGTVNADLGSDKFKLDLSNYNFVNGVAESDDVTVADFNAAVSFEISVCTGADVILRKTTDTSRSQECAVWVDGKKVGIWKTSASGTEAVAESYFTIGASRFSSDSAAITLVPVGDNNIARLDVLQKDGEVTVCRDSVNFADDVQHNLQGTFTKRPWRCAGVNTLNKQCEEVLKTLSNGIDSYGLLHSLYLSVRYGNEPKPDIYVPLSVLLGLGEYEFYAVQSITQGISDGGVCYFYLPMPYNDGIRVELVNVNSFDLSKFSYSVSVNELPLEESHNLQLLKIRNEYYDYTQKGEPLVWLEESGSGKLVGLEISAQGNPSYEYLEGDEIVCVDGNKSHVSYGTGTEDIINSAWYFVEGSFTQAFHGAPTVGKAPNGRGRNSMYAWYVLNQINFRDGIYATVEHGPQNLTQGEQTHIAAFYYHNDNPQMVKTGEIDYKDAATASNDERIFSGRLEGNFSAEFLTNEGRRLIGSSTYSVKISENNEGVLLRRLFSMDNVKQAAQVYVDGQSVGVWYNNYNRGKDGIMRFDDYIIPAKFTKNKSEITVTFETLDGYVFDETVYEVFSLGYDVVIDTDNDGIADIDDGSTVIEGDGAALDVSYQNVSGVTIKLEKSALAEQQIENALKALGNGEIIDSFALTISKENTDFNFDYYVWAVVNKNYGEDCVVVKADENIEVIQCYGIDNLRFKIKSGGQYLVVKVTQ